MKFSHVRAFKAVFEIGTVTGAANYLHVTQPAVSHLVSALEHDLGFRLFDRLKGRLHPTEDGRTFYAEVDKVFAGLEALKKRGRAIRDQTTSSLTIAAMPLLSNYFLPMVIHSLRQSGDQLAPLKILTFRSDEVANRVAMQTCDFGFSLEVASSVDVRCIRLQCRNVCLIPRAHWQTGRRRRVDLAQIAQLPLIRHENDPTQKTLDGLLAEKGLMASVQVEVSFASTVAAMVSLGDGAAVSDPFSAQLATKLDPTVVVATISTDLPFVFYLMLPQRRTISQYAASFFQAFDEQCQRAGIGLQVEMLEDGKADAQVHDGIAQALGVATGKSAKPIHRV